MPLLVSDHVIVVDLLDDVQQALLVPVEIINNHADDDKTFYFLKALHHVGLFLYLTDMLCLC